MVEFYVESSVNNILLKLICILLFVRFGLVIDISSLLDNVINK